MSPAALRTRHRALGALGPTFGGMAPVLDDTTWRALADLTDQHHLTAALRAAVFEAPGASLPADVSRGLDRVYRHNFGRSMRIADQLHHVIAALNARGVIPGPLKGALHMLEGTFRHPAERVMADLDLLVPPADLDRATEALRSLGYQEPAQAEFKTQHEVLLTGPGQQVPVEIHSDLGVPAVTRVLSASTYLKGMAVERRGLTYRVADPAHVVLHNVLHAQIQDHNHMVFGLPLRQLHTLTAFVDRHESHLDWSEVRHRMAAANLTAMLDSYLDLAHQFMAFPGDLAPQPSRALWARRAMCVANTDLRGRPGDLVRNVQEAFDADYVRSRYGGGSSLLRLRTRHASVLWRTQGKGTLNEAAAVSRWR